MRDSLQDEIMTDRPANLFSKRRELSVEGADAAARFDTNDAKDTPLADQIVSSIWNSLPFVRWGSEGADDLDLLLKKYGASVAKLASCHEAAEDFLRTVCLANFEVRWEDSARVDGPQEIVEGERSRSLEQFRLRPLPFDKILSARLTNESVSVLFLRMHDALKAQTERLVHDFLETCAQLAKQEILGHIQWENSSACVLTFFRTVVVVGQVRSARTFGKVIAEDPSAPHVIYSRTDAATKSAEIEVRKARFEHHLFKANRVAIDKNVAIIPLRFQEVAKAVPEWLRPNMDIVTGVQFREQILESQERVESWTHVREEYVLVSEPAFALGPIVFTGWGTAEIEEENQREEESARSALTESTAVFARGQRNQRVLLLACHQILSILIFVAGLTDDKRLLWLGAAWAILGIWLAYASLRYDAQARGKDALLKDIGLGLAAFVVSSVCFHLSVIGLILRLWLLLAAGCPLVGMAAALVRRIKATRDA